MPHDAARPPSKTAEFIRAFESALNEAARIGKITDRDYRYTRVVPGCGT